MSELTEAYKIMQEHCGIERGDKMKILWVPSEKDYLGSNYAHWSSGEDYIGEVVEVIAVPPGKIEFERLKTGGYNHLPCFCLELVEKAKPKLPPIMVGGNEVKFIKGDIPRIEVCSVSVHKETLRAILERLEN